MGLLHPLQFFKGKRAAFAPQDFGQPTQQSVSCSNKYWSMKLEVRIFLVCKVPGKWNVKKKKNGEGRDVNKPVDIQMAEKEIEGSSEGIFAKLKLCCPSQLSDEVKGTFIGLCRIQEKKEGEALQEFTSVSFSITHGSHSHCQEKPLVSTLEPEEPVGIVGNFGQILRTVEKPLKY